MAPLFLAKGGGCCMPHGACTLLRGPTNGPQRLLVVVYIATTALLTPCRATTSWNSLQATQQAPDIEKTAGAPVCMAEPAAAACNCMGSQQLCHSCSCSLPANENDYAHSLECASTAGDLQKAPRTCLQDRASCCSMQLHGQPTALSWLFSFTPSKQEQLCTLLRVCIHR